MRLTVPATTYAVDATVPAHAGHLTVEVPTDPAAPRQISAHIYRGDIQILAPIAPPAPDRVITAVCCR